MDATMENKIGMPPPYEQAMPNPTVPPPSYFGNNPPPPPGLVVPPTAPRTTVITTPPPPGGGGRPSKLGPGPTGTTCVTCNRSIVTRVDYVPNNRTHIVSAALCVVARSIVTRVDYVPNNRTHIVSAALCVVASCCCGCFVPYCMRSCKTANHYCPQCKAFVGSYVPS